STKHTLEERKQLYNNYKNSALYLTIDYIDLAYFSSFLILYKGVEGLNNNTNKLEEHFNINNYNNYSYSNFFTETFNSIASNIIRAKTLAILQD
ncbi:polyprotein, partial [Diplocarpon rosae]